MYLLRAALRTPGQLLLGTAACRMCREWASDGLCAGVCPPGLVGPGGCSLCKARLENTYLPLGCEFNIWGTSYACPCPAM